MRAFAEKLEPGDVVITFNYDATLERVLLDQGMWSFRDGYGFELVFQTSRHDRTLVPLQKSRTRILHLHGATGWYRRPTFRPGYEPQGSGAVPVEVFGAAPLNTHISLDPQFLEALGISNVDACCPNHFPSVMRDTSCCIRAFKDSRKSTIRKPCAPKSMDEGSGSAARLRSHLHHRVQPTQGRCRLSDTASHHSSKRWRHDSQSQ